MPLYAAVKCKSDPDHRYHLIVSDHTGLRFDVPEGDALCSRLVRKYLSREEWDAGKQAAFEKVGSLQTLKKIDVDEEDLNSLKRCVVVDR